MVARPGADPFVGARPVVGLAISLALHALVIVGAVTHLGSQRGPSEAPAREPTVTVLTLLPPEPERSSPDPDPEPAPPPPRPDAPALPPPPIPLPDRVQPVVPPQPATMAAPPAPTAEEWAFASTYTLKNSKAYRYTWGQQVRSMMGTAVEGPDQGMVRFRVEIAPDGRLTRLETLWSTSALAERLAREAIGQMPQWPPTPTGKPLIFEKTVSFSPFASEGPPLYRNDCLPDPPAFRNPYAWDGGSTRDPAPPEPAETPDPEALEDCLKQLPKDSIEAEMARDQRLMDRWGWSASQPRR
ncbi:MAG: energy transducer TonB [Burkholderiaceae bacterium]|nr:energy transducer TonB [Burkholderiaceae bacterium]